MKLKRFMTNILSCAICIATLIVTCVGIYFLSGFYIYSTKSTYYRIIFYPRKVVFETDEEFLSVALDTSFMGCLFHKLNERDWEKLEELSSLLSPGYLRLGGTLADRVIFSPDGNNVPDVKSCEEAPPNGDLIITGRDWIKLNNFAKKSGLNLIMDLNVLLRSNFKWNSTNAQSLIKFSEENGFPLDFQLGNEPNSFPHVFNVTLPGSALAKDFYELRQVLNSTRKYLSSKLIGPDVTRPKTKVKSSSLKYLEEFLNEESTVDIVSWHQYYLNGRNATLEDFISPETLDLLRRQIESITKVVRKSSTKLPIWISETSSAYGGGAPQLSDRFAASFLWLDKLGMAARMGMSVVIRQSLLKDHYALINKDLTPSPDFWISFLYKNLVGRRVLSVKVSSQNETVKDLRFYSHCLSSKSKINGSFVIFGMNLNNETAYLVTSGVSLKYPISSFVFQPNLNNLRAKSVLLNGEKLVYNRITISDLFNKVKEVELPLVSPRYSICFWVLTEVNRTMCAS